MKNEFIELHERETGNAIMVRISAIDCVEGFDDFSLLTIGGEKYFVADSYKKIRGMLVPPDSISIKYSEEDKKRIEKLIDEWNKVGCTTFSSLGMNGIEPLQDLVIKS